MQVNRPYELSYVDYDRLESFAEKHRLKPTDCLLALIKQECPVHVLAFDWCTLTDPCPHEPLANLNGFVRLFEDDLIKLSKGEEVFVSKFRHLDTKSWFSRCLQHHPGWSSNQFVHTPPTKTTLQDLYIHKHYVAFARQALKATEKFVKLTPPARRFMDRPRHKQVANKEKHWQTLFMGAAHICLIHGDKVKNGRDLARRVRELHLPPGTLNRKSENLMARTFNRSFDLSAELDFYFEHMHELRRAIVYARLPQTQGLSIAELADLMAKPYTDIRPPNDFRPPQTGAAEIRALLQEAKNRFSTGKQRR